MGLRHLLDWSDFATGTLPALPLQHKVVLPPAAASFQSLQDEVNASEAIEDQADEARALTTAARVLADRTDALVEANRLEFADAEISERTRAASRLLGDIPSALQKVNEHLENLLTDRQHLLDLRQFGGAADPEMRLPILKAMRQHAQSAERQLMEAVRLGQHASDLAQGAQQQAASARPLMRTSDVRLLPDEEEEQASLAADQYELARGNLDEEDLSPAEIRELEARRAFEEADLGRPDDKVGDTSAGCHCDPQATCGLQGRSFTWCRVGGGRCPLLRLDAEGRSLDPGGADHNLFKATGSSAWPTTGARSERSGAVWDYCTVEHSSDAPGAPPRTAHGGVCAWNEDLLNRYAKDPAYLKADGSVNLQKVPPRDRLAVEVMLQYQKDPEGHSLCSATVGSDKFSVCPAAPDPEHPEAAGHGWLASRSWDFCSAKGWKPKAGLDGKPSTEVPAPVAKTLPEEDDEPTERQAQEQPITYPVHPEAMRPQPSPAPIAAPVATPGLPPRASAGATTQAMRPQPLPAPIMSPLATRGLPPSMPAVASMEALLPSSLLPWSLPFERPQDNVTVRASGDGARDSSHSRASRFAAFLTA